jgi:uncharacterized protein YraI
MMKRLVKFGIWLSVAGVGLLLGFFAPQVPPALAQQPTGSVPTVTGTPEGPFIIVDPSLSTIRVYAGPSSLGEYPAIGVLLASERAPALGVARGRPDWIMIHYQGVQGSVGWVFARYVSLSPGAELKLVDIPPTPTPQSTPTLDPTLVAAFIGQPTATRLPTFTPPAQVDLPQFSDASSESPTPGVPAGLLIFSLALFGFFGIVISYLRGR